MKTNKKNLLVRALAIVLSVLMLGSAFATLLPFVVGAADESTQEYPISGYNPGKNTYDPIPMVVIMINFDADGDGVDDNPDGDSFNDVKNKDKSIYGEQWCHTTEQDWTDRLFAHEGKTLNTYYKYISDDKFHWIPAKETYGTADNGIIAVTIKNVHPNCIQGTGQWVHCFNQIVEAADAYVDFSAYDKNGNGRVDKYELCLAFILGGAETSSGAITSSEAFGFHAYYKDYDPNNRTIVDGVEVGYSGFFGTGAISGGAALNFGVFAHELGHYLGAPDLYDTGSKGSESYTQAVGSLSLMASGAHGSQPAHLDPYLLYDFGFVSPTLVTADGTYTLYSKANSQNKYNVIKLATPNPDEYYLIENRYSSVTDGSNFDNGVQKGILIWHVDERLHRATGMKANTQNLGYDPTLVAYPPISKAETTGVSPVGTVSSPFTNDHPTYANYAYFSPTSYKFPVSKTWYTSLTEDEAKLVENLRVEVITGKSDEIQIKITGVYDPKLTPDWTARTSDITQTSMTVNYTLDRLNYCTLNSAKCEFIDASTKAVIKTDNITLDANYQFSVSYMGLEANKNYIVRVTSETSNGTGVYENDFYTLPAPVEKTKATVTVYANSDRTTKTTAKTEVGKTVTVNSAILVKKGYAFGGWYLDEALTQPFDITKPLESTDDFSIYAKWIENAKAATLTVVGAEAMAYATVPGGTFTAPVPAEKAGHTFGGWYADAECTVEFDFTKAAEGTGEVKIYAKWIAEKGDVITPNTTTEKPETPDNTTAVTPEPGANNGGNTTVIVVVAVVAVVVAAAVAVVIVLIKKKK